LKLCFFFGSGLNHLSVLSGNHVSCGDLHLVDHYSWIRIVIASISVYFHPFFLFFIQLQKNSSSLHELKVPYHVPTLLCDNLSAVSLAHNLVLHARTKHIELDIHFVREKVLAKQLTVLHVPASAQLVDPLTKPLSLSSFASIRAKLKVFSCHDPLEFEGGILEYMYLYRINQVKLVLVSN
jgi:hypothetical protein